MTEQATKFEIKVALLGYVSVGKTTVLNTLLQEKFSEVSKRRTTAGINFFKIITPQQPLSTSTTTRTATSTLTEITQDNKKLREQNNVIQEKTFHIQLKEPLVEMRDDTRLILVDIPGLNEADSKEMYLKYVTENWDTFDCVIIVMDAEKGVNTEEDVKLLQFVKSMLDSEKSIPVIILCNKVDETDDEELMELVNEVQHRVEEIFSVGNRARSLEQMLVAARQGRRCTDESLVYPVFLPLSAGNAFAYRTTARCSFEKFHELDAKLIDKLGRDGFGKTKWKKLSFEEKCNVAYDAVSDPAQYQELLAATNFDKFLLALSYSVGGSRVQSDLLEKQTEVFLRNLSPDMLVAPQLRTAYEKLRVLRKDPNQLKDVFRTAYDERARIAVIMLYDELNISKFNGLVNELVAYRDFASEIGWLAEEEVNITNLMTDLVRRQIKFVLREERYWKIDDAVIGQYSTTQGSLRQIDPYTKGKRSGKRSKRSQRYIYKPEQEKKNCPWNWERIDGNKWQNILTKEVKESEHNPESGALTWMALTYHDWSTIIGSMLMMASNPHFVERFGREKMELERLLLRHNLFATCTAECQTPAERKAKENISLLSAGTYVHGEFVPKEPLMYNFVVQVVAPERISDHSHWGYLIWKFCKFMDTVDHHSV